MVTQNTNPFILPGFGQDGDMASNPMLASMEMMRKAWEGLATASGFDASQGLPGMSPEDLERRIADLRAVENWLRMNLSMLSSTIQALEVQRSTLSTLQAFVASAGGAQQAGTTPSPLDVALGIRRGADAAPTADTSGLFGSRPKAPGSAQSASTDPRSASTDSRQADAAQASSEPQAAATPTATDATSAVMKSWWDMLQSQFDSLASAAAAGIQGAEAIQEAASTAQKKAVESTQAAAEALKQSTGVAAQPAKKAATKKAAAKKSTGKKSAATKTAATKASGTKTAGKTSAARKTAAKKSAASTRNH